MRTEDGAAADLLTRADAVSRTTTRAFALLAVAGMLVISLLSTADVLMRFLLNRPIGGFNELAELAMAAIIAGCFPAVLASRRNLTVDFLEAVFSRRQKRILATVSGALGVVFMIVLTWRFAIHAQGLAQRDATTVTLLLPMAPFWWAVVGALAACIPVQAIASLVHVRDVARSAPEPEAQRAAAFLPARWHAPLAAGVALVALAGSFVLLMPTEWLPALKSWGLRSPGAVTIVAFVTMLALLMLQVPLAVAMGLTGLAAVSAVHGSPAPGLFTLATNSADLLASLDLATIPLFVMMGGFAAAAGVSGDIYRLAHAALGRFRGGLALATIGACAGFGAITGSSVANAATMGRVSLPEMRQRGYSIELATGSVAAGGTLGMLIPPSSVMIIFAVLASASIGKMYIAAMLPALIAVALYLLVVVAVTRLRPAAAPAGEWVGARALALAALRSWTVVALFGLVIGGIYVGVFTATEAAAVGAGAAFLFAVARGGLRGGGFWRVLDETAASAGMLYLVTIGASAFGFFIGFVRLPNDIVGFVQGLDMAPALVLVLILLFYVFLGCFMDPFTMLFVTLPIVLPIVTGFGYDVIWWGILTVTVIEIGMLTPPVGLNVFVIKSVVPDVPLSRVFAGVMPFVAVDAVRLAILFAVPALVLWLPGTMR
ncbi:MAG: TRAP transporter large permease subunit [Candidatus Odyssella sp.]|nr:TRAP transporter large permease subunit [Candidatus Odyssella sp.]